MQKIFFFAKILMAIVVVLWMVSLFNFSAFWNNYISMTLSERAEIAKIFIEATAIIIAGLWTYELYIKNRYDYPYPKIEHRIEHHPMDSGLVYVSVFVTVTNEGKTKLDLGGGKIFLRQVLQLTPEALKSLKKTIRDSKVDDIRYGKVENLFIDEGQRLSWVTLGEREWNKLRPGLIELEPGQTREIQFEFLLLENDVKVIAAISYFKYAKSSWELSTLYTLPSEKSPESPVANIN